MKVLVAFFLSLFGLGDGSDQVAANASLGERAALCSTAIGQSYPVGGKMHINGKTYRCEASTERVNGEYVFSTPRWRQL